MLYAMVKRRNGCDVNDFDDDDESQTIGDETLRAQVVCWERRRKRHCECSQHGQRVCATVDPWRSATAGVLQGHDNVALKASCRSAADQVLLRLHADHDVALFPFTESDWFPPPRTLRSGANARWVRARCPKCRCWHASLIASCNIPPDMEVTVDSAPTFFATPTLNAGLVLSFDGGARPQEPGSTWNGGAGAILWRADSQGSLVPQAKAVVALPGERRAPIAEAQGCKAALKLLAKTNTAARPLTIIGDNLGIVRLGAGQARFKDSDFYAILAESLGDLALAGWAPKWIAVRRRFNKAADALATAGVKWAATMDDDPGAVHTWFQWLPTRNDRPGTEEDTSF